MTRAPETFRAEVREWLEQNCPPAMRTRIISDAEEVWGGRRATFPHPDAKVWLERMGAKGWTAPTWPKVYGGGGLTREEARILQEEMNRLGCRRPLASLGIWMFGPVLLESGTEAQKLEFLPPMVRGETRWCQGFSEPGAGSDLAGLQMRAVRYGDDYILDGQKVWTSHANLADWMFCLVRTDPSAPKHEGISAILVDMASPGVSVRPIQLISGASPFCEAFLENVRVPAANIVGPLNGGWNIARSVLQHERGMIAQMRADAPQQNVGKIETTALRYFGLTEGPLPDASLRDRITRLRMDEHSFTLTLKRSQEAARAGKPPGNETSLFKLYGMELKKRRCELMVDVMGLEGLGWEDPSFSVESLDATRQWLRSRANSIEGGTSEIQLNIIAKRVLGLPD